MKTVNIHEAKIYFPKLIAAVIQGNEILIAVAGKPVAKLTPIEKKPVRKPGVLKGKIKISKDFDAALPQEILDQFEG